MGKYGPRVGADILAYNLPVVPSQRTALGRTRFSPPLPLEIVSCIFTYLQPPEKSAQALFAALCLVCRAWYGPAVRYLYNSSHVSHRGFECFARVISNSLNTRGSNSGLPELITVLDISSLRLGHQQDLCARYVFPHVTFQVLIVKTTIFEIVENEIGIQQSDEELDNHVKRGILWVCLRKLVGILTSHFNIGS